MTVYEALALMIAFSVLVVSILTAVITAVCKILQKK